MDVLLFLLIGLSDIYDGKLARKWDVQSKMGAGLDVVADFFFIFTTNYILYIQSNLSFWVLMMIVGKMLEFILTSRILRKKKRKDTLFIFDNIGRYVALAFYILPIMVIGMRELLPTAMFWTVQNIVIFCIAISALLSSGWRIYCCIGK